MTQVLGVGGGQAHMTRLRSLVPILHVESVPRSITFYRQLGFELGNSLVPDGESEPVWAWLQSGGAQLMLARADAPVEASRQAVLLYLYCEDVAALRTELQQQGLTVGGITYPFYAPRGEFRVTDPDGFVLMVTHT